MRSGRRLRPDDRECPGPTSAYAEQIQPHGSATSQTTANLRVPRADDRSSEMDLTVLGGPPRMRSGRGREAHQCPGRRPTSAYAERNPEFFARTRRKTGQPPPTRSGHGRHLALLGAVRRTSAYAERTGSAPTAWTSSSVNFHLRGADDLDCGAETHTPGGPPPTRSERGRPAVPARPPRPTSAYAERTRTCRTW